MTLAPDGRVLEANRATARLFALDAVQMIGRPLGELIELHEPAELTGHLDACLRGRRTIATDLRFRVRAGDWRVMDMLSAPVSLGDQLVTSTACRDITARTELESSLRLLAALGDRLLGVLDVRQVAEQLTRVLSPAFARGCAVYWDEQNGEYGNEASPALVRVALLDPGQDPPGSLPDDAELQAALATSVSDSLSSGAARRVSVGQLSAWILPLATGERTRGALVLLEPDNQHPRPAWRSLADEVARRATLALQAASKHRDCERDLEHRGELIAMLSHDMRNALGSASMNCQLLERANDAPTDAPATRSRRLGAIRRAVDWMTELVEDLLDQRALERGRLAMDRESLDAAALCHEAVALQDTAALARGVRIVVDDAAGVDAFVTADHCRAVQVLDNLIANAVAASPEAGEVVVRVERHHDRVLFSVRDSGAGIPLHGPDGGSVFRGGLRRLESRGRGRGLGLPIAHSLVRALGGRLWVESATGAGSVFLFTLPGCEAEKRSA